MNKFPLECGVPQIEKVCEALCKPAPYQAMSYDSPGDSPMPSLEALTEMMNRLRAALFPGYFGNTRISRNSLRYHLSANLDSIFRLLQEQIRRGICFTCADTEPLCPNCGREAGDKALAFLDELPRIRDLLAGDVKAAYDGDPAAKTPGETIFCYPSITTMTNHRIAHCLYTLGVPLIPRIISEMAHSATGIDIHPGASIGEQFFIDHGTGVVIGETSVIGNNCRLYQGVTLGALSFAKDESGALVKGQPRHPILEDNVTVYAGATVLGRITIGAGSIIGGNVWLTKSVPPDSRVVQQRSAAAASDEALRG
ncbi:serine acetyltransferase [Desulfovibrio sp. OttesenSCG-928-F20]|nr:serine acetyltransferase [Desulfovibrio sp. OttesenSCG-928-M16]MDL2291251.1 serine acetyltransferase [Desulfovibrio sp. OttesenSCG-928-F20]